MRRVIAVALSLSLFAAGLGAPLVHAHPDDRATDHHDGQSVHAHWSGHARTHQPHDGQSIDADDHDRAVYLNAFVAVGTATFFIPAINITAVELPVPPERGAQRRFDVVRSHGPPSFRSVCPRAPPAFLS